jgi:hypothetical protein
MSQFQDLAKQKFFSKVTNPLRVLGTFASVHLGAVEADQRRVEPIFYGTPAGG